MFHFIFITHQVFFFVRYIKSDLKSQPTCEKNAASIILKIVNFWVSGLWGIRCRNNWKPCIIHKISFCVLKTCYKFLTAFYILGPCKWLLFWQKVCNVYYFVSCFDFFSQHFKFSFLRSNPTECAGQQSVNILLYCHAMTNIITNSCFFTLILPIPHFIPLSQQHW